MKATATGKTTGQGKQLNGKEHQERRERGNRCTSRKRKYKWEGKANVEGESGTEQFERTEHKHEKAAVQMSQNK